MPQLVLHRQRINKLEHLCSKDILSVKMRHDTIFKPLAATIEEPSDEEIDDCNIE